MAATAFAAGTAPQGLDSRDETMVAVAAFLSDPPRLSLSALLSPPITSYIVVGEQDWFKAFEPLNQRLKSLGMGVKVGFKDHAWTPEISCGKFGYNVSSLGEQEWSHPDGPPPDCPHDQGTDHPGTIKVTGTFWMAVTETALDANVPDQPEVFRAEWRFDCVYADGSKDGRAPCTVTKVQAKAPETPAPAANANAAGQVPKKSLVPVAGAAAATIGIGAFFWMRSRKKK